MRAIHLRRSLPSGTRGFAQAEDDPAHQRIAWQADSLPKRAEFAYAGGFSSISTSVLSEKYVA
jgi:hypothetical protein